MRRLLHREEPSNELIIHIAGTFGLVYAVLLGLLTVATFQNTKDLQDNVGREASSLSTIYRITDAYPEPLRSELKAQLRDYTHYLIDKDWPAHRKGMVPMGGEHRLQVIRAQLMSFGPATKTQEVLHSELLRYLECYDGATRAAIGERHRGHPACLMVCGRYRRPSQHCVSVDASHGADTADPIGRDYRLLSRDRDFFDLRHGSSTARCGQRPAGFVHIGL